MRTSESLALVMVASFAIAILTAGWWIAFYFQWPEAFQRTGALLSAFGTLGVVWQVYIEMILEEGVKDVEQAFREDSPSAPPRTSGFRELKERLLRNVKRVEIDRYRIRRLRYVGFFATLLAIGIFIHGFGDYLVPRVHTNQATMNGQLHSVKHFSTH